MNFMALAKAIGKPVNKKKGEHLFQQGASSHCIYWLSSGLLKAYYTTTEGKELIKSFISPENIIGNLSSAYSGEPCSFGLMCLEDSQLLEIPFAAIHKHSQTDHALANHMVELLLQLAMKKEKREYEFLCLSAEERYRAFVQEAPDVVSQITQNDLAKYLGITGVGLSRIKKRVKGTSKNSDFFCESKEAPPGRLNGFRR